MKERTRKILEEFDFERMKKNKSKCICYEQDKPCHSPEQLNGQSLNCYFCYCPNYGEKCKINSPSAKYIKTLNGKNLLDCSDCAFPHLRENLIRLIEGEDDKN